MNAILKFLKSAIFLTLRISLVIAVIALISLAGFFGKQKSKLAIPYIAGLWESKFEMEWQQRLIAGLAFETPKPLTKTENTDPGMVKTRALYSEMYNSKSGHFQIMLYHVCFKPGMPLSLDGAATGMGNNLVEQFGKEKCTFDTTHTSISGNKAIRVVVNGQNENEKGYLRGLVMSKDTDMWTLMTIYTDKFPKGEEFSNRILGSVNLSGNRNTFHDSLLQIALTQAKLTSKDIAQMAYPAVVTVIARDNSGNAKGFGSGFFITNDLVATNYHVIENADSASVVLVGNKTGNPVIGAVAVDTSSDLAILRVTYTNKSVLPVDTCNGVSVGDDIYAVGNPEGLRGTISSGIISAIRGESNSIYQITAPISKGSSGGPVIGANGKVVGVSVGMLSTGQNLNFAVPSCYLLSLYQEISEPVSLSALRFLKLFDEDEHSDIDLEKQDETAEVNTENVSSKKPITASTLYWDVSTYKSILEDYGVEYSFSLHNNTVGPLRNIVYLIKFYDENMNVIDTKEHTLYKTIRPSMAVRVTGKIEWPTFALSVDYNQNYSKITSINKSRIDVEILKYQYSY